MTDQNQQALPPLESELEYAGDDWIRLDIAQAEYGLLKEQLRQALRERDEARKSLALFQSENPDLGDLSFREQLRSQLIRQGLQASEALAAANRRAEEAFNEGVEAAANDIETESDPELEDIMQSVRANIRNLKRPTQPEQTR